MQCAVLNRAIIEVADKTDVSGRVTADEVNLDRFHNRIRKVCALVAATLIPSSLRWMLLFTVLIVPQVLWGVASARAQFAYVANEGGNNVSAYSIGANGALPSVPGSPVAAGSGLG